MPFLTTIPGHHQFMRRQSFAELETYLRRALFDTPGIADGALTQGGRAAGLPELPASEAVYPAQGRRGGYAAGHLRAYFCECRAGGAANGGEGAAGFGASSSGRPRSTGLASRPPAAYRRVIFFEEGSPAGGVAEHFGTQLTALHYTGDYRIQAVEPFILTCKTDAGLAPCRTGGRRHAAGDEAD